MMYGLVVTGGGKPIAVIGRFHSRSTAEHKASALRVQIARDAPEPDDPFERGLEVVVVPIDSFPKEGK